VIFSPTYSVVCGFYAQLHQHCHSLGHPSLSLTLLHSLRLYEFSLSSMAGWCRPEPLPSVTPLSLFTSPSFLWLLFLPFHSLFPCTPPAIFPTCSCSHVSILYLVALALTSPFLPFILYISSYSIYLVLGLLWYIPGWYWEKDLALLVQDEW